MIKINIIPQDKKREIAINKKMGIYLKFLSIIIVNFIIYSLIFLTVRIIMQKYYNDSKNQALVLNKTTGDYTQEAKEINSQIEYIKNIQENFISWSDFFALLSEIKTEGVTYKQIKISKNENLLLISGIAKTRDDLLNFKNRIEESKILSDVELPFSVLLEKSDIDFNIKTKISSYEF